MADAVESVESVEEMKKQIMQTELVRDKFFDEQLEELEHMVSSMRKRLLVRIEGLSHRYPRFRSTSPRIATVMRGYTSPVPIPKPRQECPRSIRCDRGRGGDESGNDNGESGGELRHCYPYLVST